jgi:hypothetical protein
VRAQTRETDHCSAGSGGSACRRSEWFLALVSGATSPRSCWLSMPGNVNALSPPGWNGKVRGQTEFQVNLKLGLTPCPATAWPVPCLRSSGELRAGKALSRAANAQGSLGWRSVS